MAGTGIFGIVVSKLHHEKKLYPIILLEVDKSLEIGFYYTILPLSLTVRLRVKGGREFLLNVEEIT